MLYVSQTLRDRIKLSSVPAYKLAITFAGCHPTTLSKLLNGAERVRPNDARIVAVGKCLGVSADDCFVEEVELPKGRDAVSAA
jgi:hypothetical protein